MIKKLQSGLIRLLMLVFITACIGLLASIHAHSDATPGNEFDENAIVISGMVVDNDTGDPLPGVNVTVQGRVVGVATRTDGTFRLNVSGEPPITLVVSLVGYRTRQIEINDNEVTDLVIELQEETILGTDVVVSASRVEQSILEAPVSIEKMDIIAISQTASDNYYKSLANLKGVDVTTSSINFQIINSRGFNSTGNTRMVQLIDGMDTQAPALNFPIGNLNGPSELDIESVEFIPGASSALYGPNAFNGILLINSKSPFRYQGLSAKVQTGLNHIDGNQDLGEPGSPEMMFETSIRYADTINDRFAYKFNFSYSQAEDWRGINYTDKNAHLQGDLGHNPAYDGIHMFGDEASLNIGLLAFSDNFIQAVAQQFFNGNEQQAQQYSMANLPIQPVNRTGYREQFLVDYGAENLKFNTSLHYLLSDNAELSYTFNYGYGTSIYTGAQRYSLNNFSIAQHKLELRGDNYMLRGYTTLEDSGDSYIADFVGFAVNEAYSPNTEWFGTYGVSYLGFLLNQGVGFDGGANTQTQTLAHQFARNMSDQNRIQPNSAQFDAVKDAALSARVPNGALFDDSSRFLHLEGQYDFKNEIDFLDMQAGVTFRQFQLRSNGTIFDDEGGVNINEYGGYLQASRPLFDGFQLTGSIRYDKNENFDGQFSPRISGVWTVAEKHNFRGSFQTGFRNATTQGQYIDLNVISARLIGGLPQFAEKYNITHDTYTLESVQAYTNQFLQNPTDPANAMQAIGLLERYAVHNPVQPEQIKAYEIGYKGLITDRLLVDAAYYYNVYDDFITQIRIRRAAGPIDPADPQTAIPTSTSLLSGDFNNTFQVYTNIDNTVRAQGAMFGFEYSLPRNYRVGFNYNWNQLIDGLEDEFMNDFNTPEHKINLTVGNRRLTNNLGFAVTYRWQDAFRWESSFAQIDVDAVSTLDAQVSYRVPSFNSVIKVGGTNILNQHYTLSGGGPNLGSIFYMSVTFDQMFR